MSAPPAGSDRAGTVAVLNHLLWLKARTSSRMRASESANVLSVGGVLAGLFVSLSLGVLVLLLTAEAGPELARPVLAAALAALYLSWITAPALGYRLNEGLDPSLLGQYPVPTSVLVLGSFLGNFLDPVLLVTSPVLVACVAAGVLMGGSPLLGAAGALLFLFHAMGATQVVHVLMLGLLRRRRMRDLMLVIVPGVLMVAVFLVEYKMFEAGEMGTTRFTVETAREMRWVEHLATLGPPGLLMEAVLPPAPGGVFGPAWACLLLLAVAAVTVLVAAVVSRAAAEGGAASADARRRRPGSRRDPVFAFFRRLVPSTPVAARATAEFRLLVREPQYILMYLVFLMMFVLLLAIEGSEVADQSKAVLVPLLLFSSIFVFVGPMFNAFAVERGGLRYAFATPIDPLAYLIGKNLGAWLPITLAHVAGLVLTAIGVGLSPVEFLGALVAGQVSLWVLMGIGNVVSCLAPQPLPVHGIAPPRSTSISQVAVVIVVGLLGITLGGWIATVGGVLLFGLPALLGTGGASLYFFVLGLGWIGGVYTISTALAARLFRRRQEFIIEVLA